MLSFSFFFFFALLYCFLSGVSPCAFHFLIPKREESQKAIIVVLFHERGWDEGDGEVVHTHEGVVRERFLFVEILRWWTGKTNGLQTEHEAATVECETRSCL